MLIDDLLPRIVSESWRDAGFLERLRSDARSTLREQFGYDVPAGVELSFSAGTSATVQVSIVLPCAPAGDFTEFFAC